MRMELVALKKPGAAGPKIISPRQVHERRSMDNIQERAGEHDEQKQELKGNLSGGFPEFLRNLKRQPCAEIEDARI